MSALIYKLIAIVTMIVGTLAASGFASGLGAIGIGEMAFPLYAFLLAEGFRWYKDDKKRLILHVVRLFVLTVVTELCFDFLETGTLVSWDTQSAVLSLFLGLVGLFLTEKFRNDEQMYVLVIYFVFAYITYILKADYMVSGVLSVFGFYWFLERAEEKEYARGKKIGMLLLFGLVYLVLGIASAAGFDFPAILSAFRGQIPAILLTFVSFLLVAFYNDRLGFTNKVTHVLYPWIYPVLLLILGLSK